MMTYGPASYWKIQCVSKGDMQEWICSIHNNVEIDKDMDSQIVKTFCSL